MYIHFIDNQISSILSSLCSIFHLIGSLNERIAVIELLASEDQQLTYDDGLHTQIYQNKGPISQIFRINQDQSRSTNRPGSGI